MCITVDPAIVCVCVCAYRYEYTPNQYMRTYMYTYTHTPTLLYSMHMTPQRLRMLPFAHHVMLLVTACIRRSAPTCTVLLCAHGHTLGVSDCVHHRNVQYAVLHAHTWAVLWSATTHAPLLVFTCHATCIKNACVCMCACVHVCKRAYVCINILVVAMCGHAPCCLTMQPWHCA